MASVASSSSICYRHPTPRIPNPKPITLPFLQQHHYHHSPRGAIPSLSCSSSFSSPFTEFDSDERHRRDSWLYKDNEVSNQLPDLKNLLRLLHLKRKEGSGSGVGGGPGSVWLVGTGPGDPELLTLKAARAIGSADLVLYDRLVSQEVLGLVGPSARLLYVGKTAGYHSRTQEEIHHLLLGFAEAGASVVRLKGGDPLVFGRGGEEMDFLQQQGIKVKVIPGITSASGIAAELGIPLTHRGVANR